MKKRTLRYNEFVNEFLNIDGRLVREFEEEAKPAENLGTPTEVQPDNSNVEAATTPEPVTEAPVEEPVAVEEPAEPATEEPKTDDKPLDLGGREDISLDEIKLKMDFINNYIKGLSTIIANVDKIPLDEKTKEDISAIFNLFQNSSETVSTDNDAIKLYFDYINTQFKAVTTLITNAEKVPLDKTSKERISGIYDIIRNIKK